MNHVISLDIWNTIIQYNPNVGNHRSRIISDITDVDESVITRVYREMKDEADYDAEVGLCYTQDEIYSRFCHNIGVNPSKYAEVIQNAVEQNFMDNPPFIHPEMFTHLRMLSSMGYDIGFASNNNFISGKVIHETVLKHLGIPIYFHINSTDVNSAKPDPTFMNEYSKHIGGKFVTHIGDNRICDDFNDYVDEVIFVDNPAHCAKILRGMYEK